MTTTREIGGELPLLLTIEDVVRIFRTTAGSVYTGRRGGHPLWSKGFHLHGRGGRLFWRREDVARFLETTTGRNR